MIFFSFSFAIKSENLQLTSIYSSSIRRIVSGKLIELSERKLSQ